MLRSLFTVYRPLTACTISEKTTDWILRKSKKSPFLGPFCPNLGKREFSQKIGLCHFWAFMHLTSCKIPKKSNEPIQRKVGYGRTDRQHWIHRTFRIRRGSKKSVQMNNFIKFERLPIQNDYHRLKRFYDIVSKVYLKDRSPWKWPLSPIDDYNTRFNVWVIWGRVCL